DAPGHGRSGGVAAMIASFPLGKLEFDAPEKWSTTTVGWVCDHFGGDVQTGPFGSQLHASDYVDDGIPIVMPQDMDDGRIVIRKIARVEQSHVVRLDRHIVRKGDIVFSRRGGVARFAVVLIWGMSRNFRFLCHRCHFKTNSLNSSSATNVFEWFS